MSKKSDYGIAQIASTKPIPALKLPYEPIDPKRYNPPIGLIGCGDLTQTHLRAYKRAGYNVVALCDVDEARVHERRKAFYPKATAYTDYRDLLKREDIQVIDIATHPAQRIPIIQAALESKKHVLSQKPFVLDLATGQKLIDLADKQNVKLAVNQNARWAPHFSYIRQAISAGLIGDVLSAHLSVHWDHNWIAATPFDNVRHILLYDFAIHWFDLITCFFSGRDPRRVYASTAHSPSQKAKPDLLAQATIEFDAGQASLSFDADTKFGPQDRTYIAGTLGTITSIGKDFTKQSVTLYTQRGVAKPKLRGTWFPDGFHGTMAELLFSIEQNREPANSARNNLPSLALCFAAVKSADTGRPQIPGEVKRLPD